MLGSIRPKVNVGVVGAPLREMMVQLGANGGEEEQQHQSHRQRLGGHSNQSVSYYENSLLVIPAQAGIQKFQAPGLPLARNISGLPLSRE
jgi:hypothetical protein